MKKIRNKQSKSKAQTVWMQQVFLVLFANMAMKMFSEAELAAGIIDELNDCYEKASKNSGKKAKVSADEPHWLQVVTDILLSLLSQNEHLLRSIVLSVWSLLAEHLTLEAFQQVLDVSNLS